MTLHPHTAKDLVLAPVAAEIDINLMRIRDKSPADIADDLELEFNRPVTEMDRDERVQLVHDQAVRNVETHGWEAAVTDDACRLRLTGGSVSLELGLGATVMDFIEHGV
jgi:hypothetical protein